MLSLRQETIVASIAYGSAVSNPWAHDIEAAISTFASSKNLTALQSDLATAAQQNAAP